MKSRKGGTGTSAWLGGEGESGALSLQICPPGAVPPLALLTFSPHSLPPYCSTYTPDLLWISSSHLLAPRSRLSQLPLETCPAAPSPRAQALPPPLLHSGQL